MQRLPLPRLRTEVPSQSLSRRSAMPVCGSLALARPAKARPGIARLALSGLGLPVPFPAESERKRGVGRVGACAAGPRQQRGRQRQLCGRRARARQATRPPLYSLTLCEEKGAGERLGGCIRCDSFACGDPTPYSLPHCRAGRSASEEFQASDTQPAG